MKKIVMLSAVACAIVLAVCLICDLAINKRLTWSLYVSCAVPFGLLTVSPMLLCKQRRPLIALATLSVTILPFLYVLERITPAVWFKALGLPLAMLTMASLWVLWLLFTFIQPKFQLNKWQLSAIQVGLYGVIVNAGANALVNMYLENRWLFGFSDIISLIACGVITALLWIIGSGKIKPAP